MQCVLQFERCMLCGCDKFTPNTSEKPCVICGLCSNPRVSTSPSSHLHVLSCDKNEARVQSQHSSKASLPPHFEAGAEIRRLSRELRFAACRVSRQDCCALQNPYPDSELQNPPTLGPRSPGKSPLTISGPASLPCNQDQGSELSYVRRDHLDYHADARGRLAQQLLTQVRPHTASFNL